ncbi:NlpC/P60 family protein [Clostridium sp. CS001]|uniref:C40 family peptidase n=1 Tax=Clostridium sp. CS001 TaxID=2880648 RepID=UPI001CF5D32A|nr:C40 family peptidase [Clostridium sp. CS001]MCB2291231.1 NlpC/P60 family protein [Clostridium sp. CS001]
MRKRILALIVTIGLATTISMPILADPLSDKLKSQKSQLAEQKAAYNQAKDKVEDIEGSIEKLDSVIEVAFAEIDKTKVKIGETEQQIDNTKKNIQVAEDNIKEEEELFNKRMRTMYMNGVDGYLEVLLSSDGIEDLISRVDNIKKIVEYDNKIIGELTDKKVKIEEQKTALETEKATLVVLIADNEKKIDKLKETKKEQSLLIAEAKKQEQLYSAKLSDAQTIVNTTMRQIQQIRDNAPKYTPSRGSSSLSSDSVVAYASNFLGTPYVWGANGPDSFDCSGFTKYVYAHFGISLTRTTYTQINEGSSISRDNLEPGDLVFFGTGSDPHHVGIYVGNNSYIHAPRTGDVVKVSALTRSDYIGARRVK